MDDYSLMDILDFFALLASKSLQVEQKTGLLSRSESGIQISYSLEITTEDVVRRGYEMLKDIV